MIKQFLLAWIPLFVAMDPVGLVPLFMGITRGISAQKIPIITRQAVMTAGLVCLGFILLGQAIFYALGISVSDFQIAGGLILFALAAKDMLSSLEPEKPLLEDIGVVPLGMPLIAGPATITTLLLIIPEVGVWAALLALFTNLVFIYFAFVKSNRLSRLIGFSGLKAFSKIIALLLAAIAVNMIRKGWEGL